MEEVREMEAFAAVVYSSNFELEGVDGGGRGGGGGDRIPGETSIITVGEGGGGGEGGHGSGGAEGQEGSGMESGFEKVWGQAVVETEKAVGEEE